MSEYIERGALLKHLCNSCDGWCENTNCDCVNCKSEHRCDIVQELDDAPAADVVSVVRCKDCKHLGIKDFVYGYCKNKMCGIIQPNDFCSYGERKDGDSDGTH